jgi:hypothetical protein
MTTLKKKDLEVGDEYLYRADEGSTPYHRWFRVMSLDAPTDSQSVMIAEVRPDGRVGDSFAYRVENLATQFVKKPSLRNPNLSKAIVLLGILKGSEDFVDTLNERLVSLEV